MKYLAFREGPIVKVPRMGGKNIISLYFAKEGHNGREERRGNQRGDESFRASWYTFQKKTKTNNQLKRKESIATVLRGESTQIEKNSTLEGGRKRSLRSRSTRSGEN